MAIESPNPSSLSHSEISGQLPQVEFLTPTDFTTITTVNIRAVIFDSSLAWESNLARLPDKVIKPSLENPDIKPEIISQFQLDLNTRLNREQMALALLSMVSTIRQHNFIKAHGPVSSREVIQATQEEKRTFYEQNRELVDRYLDNEISRYPQSPAIAGTFRSPNGSISQ